MGHRHAQWFGDTSTFAFWGDLWLAEGPATYFEVSMLPVWGHCQARSQFAEFVDTQVLLLPNSATATHVLLQATEPHRCVQNVGGEAAAPASTFLDRFYGDSVTRFLEHDAVLGATHPLATNASGMCSGHVAVCSALLALVEQHTQSCSDAMRLRRPSDLAKEQSAKMATLMCCRGWERCSNRKLLRSCGVRERSDAAEFFFLRLHCWCLNL